jgi:hypothetical protein
MTCLQSSLNYLGDNLDKLVDQFPSLSRPQVSVLLPQIMFNDVHGFIQIKYQQNLKPTQFEADLSQSQYKFPMPQTDLFGKDALLFLRAYIQFFDLNKQRTLIELGSNNYLGPLNFEVTTNSQKLENFSATPILMAHKSWQKFSDGGKQQQFIEVLKEPSIQMLFDFQRYLEENLTLLNELAAQVIFKTIQEKLGRESRLDYLNFLAVISI